MLALKSILTVNFHLIIEQNCRSYSSSFQISNCFYYFAYQLFISNINLMSAARITKNTNSKLMYTNGNTYFHIVIHICIYVFIS